jgi:A118 family predicted phage portal protein
MSTQEGELGQRIPLISVQEWAGLVDTYTHYEVEEPWIIEHVSPRNGMAIFDLALDLFRKIDELESIKEWEFKGSELAIDASIDLFMTRDKDKKGRTVMPKGKERLYRTYEGAVEDIPMKVFNPDPRDEAYARGIDDLKRSVEDTCEVARGTISDVQFQAKTATEIETTEQVTFTTIADEQDRTEDTLRRTVITMADVAWRFGLAPRYPIDSLDMGFDWDDSIITDRETEFKEKLQLFDRGIVADYQIKAWYEGISEDQAKEELPGGFAE